MSSPKPKDMSPVPMLDMNKTFQSSQPKDLTPMPDMNKTLTSFKKVPEDIKKEGESEDYSDEDDV